MKAAHWFTAGVLAGATASAVLFLAFGSRPVLEHSAAVAEAPHPVGTDTAPAETKALSMQDATTRLEARLQRDGGSADDWELLAKSYEFMGRTDDAARARKHVVTAAAGNRGAMPVSGTTSGTSMPSVSDIAKVTAMDGSTAPAAGSAEISGTVSIESRLAAHVDRSAVLFIYAKAADSPGPPLAVLRLNASGWPVNFRLDDSMAMLPSRRLSQFQKVVVEARISRSGQATPAAGDLYVTSNTISPGSGKKLALVINHEIG